MFHENNRWVAGDAISPTQRVIAGPEWTGCEDKMCLCMPHAVGAVWDSGVLDPWGGINMSSYPLKPHCCKSNFQVCRLPVLVLVLMCL